jgi:hypothetical protein
MKLKQIAAVACVSSLLALTGCDRSVVTKEVTKTEYKTQADDMEQEIDAADNADGNVSEEK